MKALNHLSLQMVFPTLCSHVSGYNISSHYAEPIWPTMILNPRSDKANKQKSLKPYISWRCKLSHMYIPQFQAVKCYKQSKKKVLLDYPGDGTWEWNLTNSRMVVRGDGTNSVFTNFITDLYPPTIIWKLGALPNQFHQDKDKDIAKSQQV